MEDIGESTEPIASDTDFAINDVVLAFHGHLLYEARVLEVHYEDETTDTDSGADRRVKSYTVHYQGWKKSWEETVSRDLVFEHNDENLRVAHRLLNGAKLQQQALQPTSSTDKDKTVDQTIPDTPSTDALFQIPAALQRQLTDDWEFVTKSYRLVPLPRNPTVAGVLQRWVSSKRQAAADRAIKEVADALQVYFDAALSKILLYRFERKQYVDFFHNADKAPPPVPSAVYGAEHLLRLLHHLPFMLESTSVGRHTMQAIAEKVNDLTKYMQKNGRILFLAEYDVASELYIDNCVDM